MCSGLSCRELSTEGLPQEGGGEEQGTSLPMMPMHAMDGVEDLSVDIVFFKGVEVCTALVCKSHVLLS